MVLLEIVAFWFVSGSRNDVLLPLFLLAVSSHYLWREWSRKVVIGAIVACVVLGGALLSIRQNSHDQSILGSVLGAPSTSTSPPRFSTT